MAVLPATTCETPPTFCNDPNFESVAMQRFMLMQLLANLAIQLSEINPAITPEELLAAASAWKCASGNDPERLMMNQAQIIADNIPAEYVVQPVCLSPLDREAIITYLICVLAESLGRQQV